MQKGEVGNMKVHIAILYKYYLDLILEGKKTIEARFSKVKSPPFGKVSEGDKILLKETGGPIRGEAKVRRVEYFSNLTPQNILEIVSLYKNELMVKEDFLELKLKSRYLTLIFLEDIKKTKEYRIDKKDRRGWVVLSDNRQPQLFDF